MKSVCRPYVSSCSTEWCVAVRRSGRLVYEPFMMRDLTRDDLRAIVRHGLNLTQGSYKGMAQMFNVPADYKRLLNFLRKYQCHLPIQEFRTISVQRAERVEQLERAIGD